MQAVSENRKRERYLIYFMGYKKNYRLMLHLIVDSKILNKIIATK